MKKIHFLVVLLLLFSLVLSACAPSAPAETTTPAEEGAAPAEEEAAPAKEEAAPAEEEAAPSDYSAPEPAFDPVALEEGAQAICSALGFSGDTAKIAYMPPATEFNYYQAIGAGIDTLAAELGAETFMLAPQSGSDIEGQMGMIQDVLTQDVDAIILSTHDENAAAPLVAKAVEQGVAVIIVNSDIPNFPTPVHGVVGYSQRNGTHAEGEYIIEMFDGEAKVGVLEGLPGYHSTERIGGYLDAFADYPGMEVVATLPTEWNVETGNTAMMDMLQAHPEIEVVITANDYISIGAALAAEALDRDDVAIFGNDGDTTGLEDIAAGKWDATVNTTPYLMGQVALQVTMDCLQGVYPGGWVETPTVIVDASNANEYLCHPENLFPAPSKEYDCSEVGEAPVAEYKAPEPAFDPVALEEGAQAVCSALGFSGDTAKIAYMPPATEFNYYQAIGAGIDTLAAELGAETFMLAPQSGSDIEGQMGMIQDVLTQDVDAIILSTHDENAAAPLVAKAVEQGVAVIIVNSDIPNFPTPVHGVVGYSQRNGTHAEGEYIIEMFDGEAKVGVLEGLPGYHSTERIGGYLDAFADYPGMEVVATLPTEWNVETGNTAMMDMLQAHPEIEVVITANDYISIGAALAAEALDRDDVAIFGNDGDTTGLEDIAAGKWDATVNTTPYLMGQVALQVTMDCLQGVYPGGWVETPTVIVDASNANEYLCHPENLFPAPSQEYECIE
ncbi:sugar ABC transporter substrate-binding protein [Chloroflexota bacterium]